MQSKVLTIVLVLFVGFATAQGLYQKTEQFLVGNGLNITLIHSDTANAQVNVNAFINYGSNSDALAIEGIAEIMASIYNESNNRYASDSLATQWDAISSSLQTQVTPAYTQLSFSVNKKNTAKAIELLAAVLSGVQFSEKWLQQQQLALRAANTIANLTTTAACVRVADGFTSGTIAVPRSSQLNSINMEGLQEIYKLYYSPVNTHIVLSGNVQGKVLKPILDSSFAAWRFQFPVSPKLPVFEKPIIQTAEYAFAAKQGTHTTICWVKNAPYFGAKDEMAFKLAFGAFQELFLTEVTGNAAAAGMQFSFVYDELQNNGTFKVIAEARNEDAYKAFDVFNEILYKFNERGITEAQLRRQKQFLRSAYLNQTPADLAVFFNPILYPDIKERKPYLSIVEKTLLKDVLEVSKTYFTQQQFKCAVVGPREIFGNTITDFKRYALSSFDVNR